MTIVGTCVISKTGKIRSFKKKTHRIWIKEPTQIINVMLTQEQVTWLKSQAFGRKTSLAAEIRTLIEQAMSTED